MPTSVKQVQLNRYEQGVLSSTPDLLVVEEPLEIRIGYGELDHRQETNFAVTMRSPGSDHELAIGLLFSEGVISSYEEILSIKPCTDRNTGEISENILRIELKEGVDYQASKGRQLMNSSCGLCGKAAIEDISFRCEHRTIPAEPRFDVKQIKSFLKAQEEAQLVFGHTGGLHSVALFNDKAELVVSREDVGRHNAMDKVVGHALTQAYIPLTNTIALLSGRAGYEMIQKAVMAGIPIVASIGAPSSLAVETAQEFGMTLIGFLKEYRFNVYSGEDRLKI